MKEINLIFKVNILKTRKNRDIKRISNKGTIMIELISEKKAIFLNNDHCNNKIDKNAETVTEIIDFSLSGKKIGSFSSIDLEKSRIPRVAKNES